MMPLSHLPTLFILIGYPVFWLELYFLGQPGGHTTWLAAGLWIALAALIGMKSVLRSRGNFLSEIKTGFGSLSFSWRWLAGAMIFFALVILGVAFLASLLPPHLAQEFDVLNYHLTLPRQHLIAGSFSHISWSSADLFLSPLDYALAPFWLVTELPNKFPQYIFFLGLLAAVYAVTRKLSHQKGAPWIAVAAVLASHGVAIQAGTAMLDVAACYFFVAFLDSCLRRRPFLAGAELACCVWAKPLIPVVALALAVLLAAGWFLFRSLVRGASLAITFDGRKGESLSLRKLLFMFLLTGSVLAAPFMMKSFSGAGTPLYPFACGMLQRDLKPAAVCTKADELMLAKDDYGHGRGPGAFIKHFWLIAVPEKGVNNSFDYPLGLPLLLFLPPFLWFLWRSLKAGIFPVLPIFCVLYWALWWFGSQQSRFLFVPLVLLIVLTIADLKRPSRALAMGLAVAMALTALSVVRAHGPDLGKAPSAVLRPQDRSLLEVSAVLRPGEIVEWGHPDAAFASFPVFVRNERSPFVIQPE